MKTHHQRDSAIRTELQRLAEANGGTLHPEDVVDAARSETSPLHNSFTWDDDEAAGKWRLHQARQLISATVIYQPQQDGSLRVVPAFVSIREDRTKDGPGYRLMATVLADEDLRSRLLRDARADMLAFKAKYRRLEELASVFAAMEQVEVEVFTPTREGMEASA